MTILYLIHPADITDNCIIDAHMSKEGAMRAARPKSWTVKPEGEYE